MGTSRVIQGLRFAVVLMLTAPTVQTVLACSRAVYVGQNAVITVRSMDWETDVVASNLWAFPRGMSRDGHAGARSISWTSKWGSVVAAAFEGATADGMNEKGLVANLLYLAKAGYPKPHDDKQPGMSVSVWAQYALDNYATVAEAVSDLRKEPFYVVPVMTPDDQEGTVHLALSDPTGDSAIFEYVDGRLVIHHGPEYRVMTNDPPYAEQLALNGYWENIGGDAVLPGTSRAADRFLRASYYIKAIPQDASARDAIAGAFSVIRNVSAPMGRPNVPATLWRTVSDHKNKRYYFESANTPNVFWVSLADIDFGSNNKAKKLTLDKGAVYAGDVGAKFQLAEPFEFLGEPKAAAKTSR